MKIYYALTTVDPIILSASIATTNNHQGLDYIPGSAILGLVANQLYSQLDHTQSWDIFHSGNVQFGYAYPVIKGQLGLPIPASWHLPKGENIAAVHNKHHLQLQNFANTHQRDQHLQYQQCRGGYITSNGDYGNVEQGIVTKTALNRDSGGAKDKSLFSYSYIKANQTFIGWIDCPTDEIKQRILAILAGEHRLGRSRGSEFGRVTITLMDSPTLPTVSVMAQRMVMWCISDCQCMDQYGSPTYIPRLGELITGATGELNLEQSFIRTTTVTKFNQKRQGFDSDQLLIAKGSVLVFEHVSITSEQLQSVIDKGIGLNRQQGLGWIIINPQWSLSSQLTTMPLFTPIRLPHLSLPVLAPSVMTNSDLLSWVKSKEKQHNALQTDTQIAEQLFFNIIDAYQLARRYNRILHAHEAGPSSSQWRRIADVLRHCHVDWQSELFNGDHRICNPDNDVLGWGIEWDNGKQFISFAAHLQSLLQPKTDLPPITTSQMQILLEILCRYDLSRYQDFKRIDSDYAGSFTKMKGNV